MNSEDQQIVDIAQDLCRQMNWNKTPKTINWRERIGIRKIPPDYFLFYSRGIFAGSMLLSTAAMGKLTPDEWRPILASGLFYYKNLNIGMFRAVLPLFAVILLEPLLIVSSSFFNGNQLLILSFGLAGLALVLLGLAFVWTLRRMRNRTFISDENAAQLVGKGPLISSLTKMASIDSSVQIGRKGLLRPSPQERINHLTDLPL